MEKTKIIFNDGTEIEVYVNGDCFIAETEPTFPEDLSTVTITKDGVETELHNVSVQEAASVDGRYWFIFVTPTQLDKIQSQMLYTALMTDTLIEEDYE